MNRTLSNTIQVGTRIHSILYGGRNGIVYAIHGDQTPETVRTFASGLHTGGSADFDIVFDNGTESRHIPECILRGVQWRIYADVAPADEIAEMRNFAKTEGERKRLEAEEASRKFNAEVEALRMDPRYAKLTQVGGKASGGKLVAVNLRVELKAAFPGVKFSITGDYNTVNIRWIDGPTTAQVEAISDRYSAGYFDGMDDSYQYTRSPFTSVFGSAQYVFENRRHSVKALTAAATIVAARYGSEPFTIETSYDGTGYINCTNHDQQRGVYDYLEQRYPFQPISEPLTQTIQ